MQGLMAEAREGKVMDRKLPKNTIILAAAKIAITAGKIFLLTTHPPATSMQKNPNS